jgi:hypothetical protein
VPQVRGSYWSARPYKYDRHEEWNSVVPATSVPGLRGNGTEGERLGLASSTWVFRETTPLSSPSQERSSEEDLRGASWWNPVPSAAARAHE